MTLNELAMIGMILICGVIFYFTHGDEDAYYPDDTVELDGIPLEELE
jgi:hypothetical protein